LININLFFDKFADNCTFSIQIMEVLIKDITSELEKIAPTEYAEHYDNVGLIVGNFNQKVENILITLDLTEEVIFESVKKKCNLIIAFHPIVFKSLKNITG